MGWQDPINAPGQEEERTGGALVRKGLGLGDLGWAGVWRGHAGGGHMIVWEERGEWDDEVVGW